MRALHAQVNSRSCAAIRAKLASRLARSLIRSAHSLTPLARKRAARSARQDEPTHAGRARRLSPS